MSDSTFWHKLAKQFQRDDPAGKFGYRWQQTSAGDGLKSRAHRPAPRFTPGNDMTLQLRFERLAWKAGHKLDPSGRNDALQVWLEELLKQHFADARNYKDWAGPETLADGTQVWTQTGYISGVFQASVDRCINFEIQGLTSEQTRDHEGRSPTWRPDTDDPVASTGSTQIEVGTTTRKSTASCAASQDAPHPAQRKKRGRKSYFTPEQLNEAHKMKQAGKSNNEIAKILYATPTSTQEQRRSVSTILKHHFGPKK